MDSIRGFLRTHGDVGLRNHLLIISSVSCANDVVKKIASCIPSAVFIIHQHGCGHLSEADIAQTRRTIVGNACNPNVGACLVVGLGCELLDAPDIAAEIREISGKRVEWLRIQDHNGSVQSVTEGVKIAEALRKFLNIRSDRVICPVSLLTVGIVGNVVKSSTENAAIGYLSDSLISKGFTVLQGESSEFLFEEICALERCGDSHARETLVQVFDRVHEKMRFLKAEPPVDVGKEKLERMGRSHFSEVILYGQRPTRKGLIHMESTRYITETMSGMTASGAQIIMAIVPGRGVIGSPIAPTVDCRDLNIENFEEDGFATIKAIIEGTLVESEISGVNTFAITRIGPST